jgi:hypothetical protein
LLLAAGQGTPARGPMGNAFAHKARPQASAEGHGHASPSLSAQTQSLVHDVLHAPGKPLDSDTRAYMEPRFGFDFSKVRIHADDRAAEAASSINARAFTSNRNIVFGAGEFAPHMESGRRLVAHELTHVVQQRAGVHLQDGMGQAGDVFETHADSVAKLVADGKPAGPLLDAYQSATTVDRAIGATIQRQEAGKETEKTPGERRAAAAKELVDKLRAAHATYKQEPKGRDWNNNKISDCTKFVQWALEGAGEGKLFGRPTATTSGMTSIIQKLTTDHKPAFRKTDPKVGDIMMWGGHVGIVYEVVDKQGTKYLIYADMGRHGANLEGINSAGVLWLKATDTAKIGSMGDGGFLGFWTPP